jgi:hypothetical protein
VQTLTVEAGEAAIEVVHPNAGFANLVPKDEKAVAD